MPSVGDTLGSYELLARLRAGGMATLFLGKRVGAAGFARPVAIKVIHSHLADDPKFTKMFIDEAMLSSKIQDPHVVHVEEFGESAGTYYLVMEYVPGASLAELLRALRSKKRALSVDVAVWLAAQVAAGLNAAHEATDDSGEPLRIVHRDVSPQNVLLAFKGHVKLIDFGIAKAGTPAETHSGALRGKVAYMPPEQAYGDDVDRRADIYALGVVLWEMLTMRRLFDAENEFLLLEKVRDPKVPPPGKVVDGIPPALDDVVMKALAPKLEDRIASADDLRTMLLAAVPSAGTKGSKELAALIAATMPEAVQKSREVLKDVLSSEVASSPERSVSPPALEVDVIVDDILETMTVALPPGVPDTGDANAVAITRPDPRSPRGRAAVALATLGLLGAGVGVGVFAFRAGPVAPPVIAAPAASPVAVPAPPPLVEDAGPAVAITPEPKASSVPRRPPKSRPGPRAPATPSAVEMHDDTPIFKRGP